MRRFPRKNSIPGKKKNGRRKPSVLPVPICFCRLPCRSYGVGAGATVAAVVGRARDRVASSRKARGIELLGRAVAGNLAARCGVAVGQRIAVRIAGRGNNVHALAGNNRIAFRRARSGTLVSEGASLPKRLLLDLNHAHRKGKCVLEADVCSRL